MQNTDPRDIVMTPMFLHNKTLYMFLGLDGTMKLC